MDKKMDKKDDKKKKRSSATDAWGATPIGWRPSGVSGSPRPKQVDAAVRETRFLPSPDHPHIAVAHADLNRLGWLHVTRIRQ